MGIEIERTYLVDATLVPWDKAHVVQHITQSYLSKDPWTRIRITDAAHAELTIKGAGNLERLEFNYPIPIKDAAEMLVLGRSQISKTRYHILYEGFNWEVDRFINGILAEIELPATDTPFIKPPWILDEVTENFRYSNAWMSEHGFPVSQP